jgi:uroporphyrinogen-III decarboxylase
MDTVKNWAELTPEQRREERFKRWLSPDVKFSSPEAEKAYKVKATRFIKAINLEEADRVPVLMPAGFFAPFYAGSNLKEAMYDYGELKRAYMKFLHDFEMDTYLGPELVMPGKVLEAIDFRLQVWPGHGLPDDNETYQFIEGEYMKADEYDALMTDPSDFWWRLFLPRVAKALKPLETLPQLSPMLAIPVFYILQYGRPEIQKALKVLMDAGTEANKWMQVVMECSRASLEAGLPSIWGGFSGAPFDMLGDLLRGTHGIMVDMYRQPEKIIEAMERMLPMLINEAVASANATNCPVVPMPLHKGDDTFMSDKQYETFYWPTFREVMMGMINEGLVPMPFAEGKYNRRLEVIKDLPRGSAVWWFDQTDMARAKEVLGDTACIAGNIPSSVLYTGTPQEVKECCRQLIEVCAPGGGYILTGGVAMNKGDPDNLRAVMEAAEEYGVYK